MKRPFEVSRAYLAKHIDVMVSTTFGDLQSQFLFLPRGSNFVEYPRFQDAYEVLKKHTSGFTKWNVDAVRRALRQDGLVFLVIRTILGMSPPEWADLARSELGVNVTQGFVRGFDGNCRKRPDCFAKLSPTRAKQSWMRVEALVKIAVDYVGKGAEKGADRTVHRLDKFDTKQGLASVQHAASFHVPYAVLLYERYPGRPFASHRDAVSAFEGRT